MNLGAQFSLSNGEVDLAAIWDGEVVGAIAKGPIGVERNQGLLSGDWWAVLKGAPHRENPMKFLAFAGQAEPQASQTKYVSYAPVNQAFEFIDRRRRSPHAPDMSRDFSRPTTSGGN